MSNKRPPEPTKPSRFDSDGNALKESDPKYSLGTFDELELTQYKTDYSKWKTESTEFDQMFQTASGLIYQRYCTYSMKTQLEGVADWTTVQLDPVKLLVSIHSLVHQGTLKEHPVLSNVRWVQRTISPRQQDSESHDAYIKRVSGNVAQLYAKVGTGLVDRSVSESQEYKTAKGASDTTAMARLLTEGREAFGTMIAFQGLQIGRYGNYQSLVESAYAISGKDEYPKTFESLRQTLSNSQFKPTPEYLAAKSKRQSNKKEDKRPAFDPKKVIDGLPAATFYQSKQSEFCYCCGSPDHKFHGCPQKKTIPKDEWAINKMDKQKKQYFQWYYENVKPTYSQGAAPAPARATVPTTVQFQGQPSGSAMSLASQSHRSGFHSPIPVPAQLQQPPTASNTQLPQFPSGSQGPTQETQFSFVPSHTQVVLSCTQVTGVSHSETTGVTAATGDEVCLLAGVSSTDEEEVCMDSGSGIDTWANEDTSWGDRPAERPVTMATNTGTSRLDTDVDTPIGKCYKNPGGRTNIRSLSGVVEDCYQKGDGSHVWFNSQIDNAFHHVKGDGTVIDYPVNEQGIYTTKIPVEVLNEIKEYKKSAPALIQTVRGNIEGFTKRQVAGAMKARELYHGLSCPGLEAFKNMIRGSQIRDCPVSITDIDNAWLIFGDDIATLKGKTVRKRSPPVVDSTGVYTVPEELHKNFEHLPATMDVFSVCGIRFLAFADLEIRNRMTQHLVNKKDETFYKAIDNIFDYYNRHDAYIRSILCDNEFASLMDPVKNELEIQLDVPPAQAHATPAERLVRTLKEGIRTGFQTTQCRKLPREVVIPMVGHSSEMGNLFPNKQGISSVYSPRQILTGKSVSYEQVKTPFGSYCIAHHQPGDTSIATMNPRGIDALYLGPILENSQGGHRFLNLTTWQQFTRQHFTVVPMPQHVIDRIEARAEAQGMPELEFHDKHGRLMPIGLPAGVAGEETGNEKLLEQVPEDPKPKSKSKSKPKSKPTRKQPKRTAKAVQHFAAEIVDGDTIEDSDSDDDSVPPLMSRPVARYSDSSDSESEDEDEGDPPMTFERFFSQVDQDPGTPMASESTPTDPPAEAPTLEVPAKAPKLPTVGWRRSQRIAAQKASLQQRILPTVLEKPRGQRSRKHKKRSPAPNPSNVQETSGGKVPVQYEKEFAQVLAQFMCEVNNRFAELSTVNDALQHGQQHLLPKGLKIWGDAAKHAARKEVDQLDKRGAFHPVDPKKCTPTELEKAQTTLMFVTEKRDGTIKARAVYNGKPTRVWQNKDDVRSPTVSLEGLMLSLCIDAKEGRDVMTLDVPNAFIQADMPQPTDGSDRVIMKVEGTLAELLVDLDPEKYGPYLAYEKGRPIIYVVVLKALYGMLIAALLWYKRFRKDLEEVGFEFNPYDPCVANRIVNGKQQTICFHVDDLKSSHVDPKVNDEFYAWCAHMYGRYGEVKNTRGVKHDYLGMTIDFSVPGKVMIDMIDYIAKACEEFPMDLSQVKSVTSAAPADLFTVGDSTKLGVTEKETFHTFTAKLLFACKRARPDMNTLISVLCTRVKEPNQDDWLKLVQGMKFLSQTVQDKLILSVDDLRVVKWWVDASFAVHHDYRSHTGAVMSYGSGAPMTISSKQKLNTRSSTDAELVGADDVMSPLLWTKLFLEAQGIDVQENILYQDNKSAILLEENGKASSGKRTRALNIRFFFIHDQVNKGNVRVVYCPTAEMKGDYFTKPLQGKLFNEHRAFIMGHDLSISN